MSTFSSFSKRGKFVQRVASYRAGDQPVYVQSRLKVVFHKENVQAGYKAGILLGGDVAYE